MLLVDVAVEVNAAAFNVKLMAEVSLAFACDAALPVKDSVRTVVLVGVTTSVRPDGTPVTEYSVLAV